jgi:hypothetical protein
MKLGSDFSGSFGTTTIPLFEVISSRDIPSTPNITYAGEYISMADWLGTKLRPPRDSELR